MQLINFCGFCSWPSENFYLVSGTAQSIILLYDTIHTSRSFYDPTLSICLCMQIAGLLLPIDVLKCNLWIVLKLSIFFIFMPILLLHQILLSTVFMLLLKILKAQWPPKLYLMKELFIKVFKEVVVHDQHLLFYFIYSFNLWYLFIYVNVILYAIFLYAIFLFCAFYVSFLFFNIIVNFLLFIIWPLLYSIFIMR